MKKFVGFRAKTYIYLMDDDSEKKKAKGTKKCEIKIKAKFNNYKNCQSNNEIILQPQLKWKVKNIVYILKESIRLH